MKRKATINHNRTKSGGILIESAAGMLVLIPLMVGGIMIIMTVGAFALYKIKLGFISNQAAQYAAGLFSWNNAYLPVSPTGDLTKLVRTSNGYTCQSAQVSQLVDQMCQTEGLPIPATTVLRDNGTTLSCQVQLAGLVYPFPIPVPLTLNDVSSATLTAYQPPAILLIHPQNSNMSSYQIAIPCYGFASGMNMRRTPQWQFTYTFPGPISYN
jgi:hypothetical protein